MMRFEAFCPELANTETRRIILPDAAYENGRLILPQDEYLLDEWYCEEPGCDCRRVMFNVMGVHANAHLATINHSFEPPEKEYRFLGQTFLDPLNRQSRWSEALLDMVTTTALKDAAYVKRLQRHYHLFKQAIADPANPGHRLLRDAEPFAPGLDLDPEMAPGKKRRAPIPPPPPRGKRKWR